jgi:hypothetical protein
MVVKFAVDGPPLAPQRSSWLRLPARSSRVGEEVTTPHGPPPPPPDRAGPPSLVSDLNVTVATIVLNEKEERCPIFATGSSPP